MKKSFWKNCIAGGVACVLMVGAYLLLQIFADNPLLFPPFSDCVKSFFCLLGAGGFWRSFFYTFLRTFCAFIFSFLFACVCAVVAYLLPLVRRVLAPIVSFLRSIPTLAVLLIILVWCKAGVAPVVVAFMTLFPALYAGILSALFQTDKGLIEMSKVYRVPLKKRVFSLYLPSALPYVMRESASSISLALKLVVSAEVLAGALYGVGGMMQDAKIYLDMPSLFALVTVTALLGLALESIGGALANAVERRLK